MTDWESSISLLDRRTLMLLLNSTRISLWSLETVWGKLDLSFTMQDKLGNLFIRGCGGFRGFDRKEYKLGLGL